MAELKASVELPYIGEDGIDEVELDRGCGEAFDASDKDGDIVSVQLASGCVFISLELQDLGESMLEAFQNESQWGNVRGFQVRPSMIEAIVDIDGTMSSNDWYYVRRWYKQA